MSFHPYLNFGGSCREAFTRYHEIFGGDLVLLPFGAMPGADAVPEEHRDLVMHAALKVGDDLLMASDDPSPEFRPMQSVFVSASLPDEAEADRVFEALSEAGTVLMPMAETFWSPRFGMCVDRFGTHWMIDVPGPAAADD